MSDSLSQRSPAAGNLLLPKTPQPPISPPRRSSSLAFSHKARTTKSPLSQPSPLAQNSSVSQLDFSQPNIGRKRNTIPSYVQDGPLPGHVAQMQRIFQAAKATLHRDMFAASSPAGSIESRMNLDESTPLEIATPQRSKELEQMASDSKEWRYSTAPQILAAPSLDVREPLPSPTLPDLSSHCQASDGDAIEPISSGFSSPLIENYQHQTIEAVMAFDTSSHQFHADMESEPPQRIQLIQPSLISYTDLDQPLTDLKVTSDGSDPDTAENSPIVEHLKRRSIGSSMDVGVPQSPNHTIYLSQPAEAAAESAKAKRKLLKDTFANYQGKGNILQDDPSHATSKPLNMQMLCPDPALHRMDPIMPCPDPLLHQYYPPLSTFTRPSSGQNEIAMFDHDDFPLPSHIIPPGTHRATASGSPMPFTRARGRPATSQSAYPPQRISPHFYTSHSQHQPFTQPRSLDGHFQPGWYHARQQLGTSSKPAYSFSTAASKVMGFNQAPDSRIRDSYKTNTLTALARPPNRFRKNGLGATIAPRGVGRYYQRPFPPNRKYSQVRSMSRQSYANENEIRFRSSPPRGQDPEILSLQQRKRAADDTLIMEENSQDGHRGFNSMLHNQDDEEIMVVDEDTKAAVRLSIFGTNTPEALRNARQGIKELSPNVQVLRKDTQQSIAARKKRRPSYWDNDLKEIRESPAGHGGVNSPVSAQASMQAEFEIASLSRSENEVDENDLIGEVARAGAHLEQRLSAIGDGLTEIAQDMEVDS